MSASTDAELVAEAAENIERCAAKMREAFKVIDEERAVIIKLRYGRRLLTSREKMEIGKCLRFLESEGLLGGRRDRADSGMRLRVGPRELFLHRQRAVHATGKRDRGEGQEHEGR